jgi:CRISPR-associated protein Cas2
MSKQFVLVVYDISNDRRRTKLHNVLLDYGTPVQYSVFECRPDDKALERMQKAIRKVTRPRKDNVRYYWLCEDCQKRIQASGSEVTSEPPAAIIT